MVRVKKRSFLLGPKSQFLAQKSDFCHATPILARLWPSERRFISHLRINFSPFRFQVMAVFVKKNLADASKSLPPKTTAVLPREAVPKIQLQKGKMG